MSPGDPSPTLEVRFHRPELCSSALAWLLLPPPAPLRALILSRELTRGVPFVIQSPLAIAMIKMTLSCLK